MLKVSIRCCSFLLGAAIALGINSAAQAQNSLTWAKVERLRNRVHFIPTGRRPRLARVADVMGIGDALRTASSSRAELRFNDGSLARIGEQAVFRFTPNTRNFQLSNGTTLLLIPPGQGSTTIQTPNAVTGIHGSALFVRVRCLAEQAADGSCANPITIVGALTNNAVGPMMTYNSSGSQQEPLYAGEMVIVEGDSIIERFEFDLETFYRTSGLAEGLELDSPTPPSSLPEELQPVWQEIQDALELQGDFDGQGQTETVVQNSNLVGPVLAANDVNSADDTLEAVQVFGSFPEFASSPAAQFHYVTAAGTDSSNSPASVAVDQTAPTVLLVEPVTSDRVRQSVIGEPVVFSERQSGTLTPVGSVAPTSAPTTATPVAAETPTPVAPNTPVVETPTTVVEVPTSAGAGAPAVTNAPPTNTPVTTVVPTSGVGTEGEDGRSQAPAEAFDWGGQNDLPSGLNQPGDVSTDAPEAADIPN